MKAVDQFKKYGHQKPAINYQKKSLIRQNWKKVLALFGCYIITLWAIMSTLVLVDLLGVKSHSDTDKERFIYRIFLNTHSGLIYVDL